MKTLVEFLDREPIKNILCSMVFEPEYVIFICDINTDHNHRYKHAKKFIQNRLKNTKVIKISADCSSMEQIKQVIETIFQQNDDVVFDLTGGKELALLAIGMFCDEIDKLVACYYIDLELKKFINIQNCEELETKFLIPKFKAKDIIESNGAKIMGFAHYTPDLSENMISEQIGSIIRIISEDDYKNWTVFGGYMSKAISGCRDWGDGLTVFTNRRINISENKYINCNFKILSELQKANILTYKSTETVVEIKFLDAKVKSLFTDVGAWLEYHAYIKAMESRYFDDVQISLKIDWDGILTCIDNPECEIDLILTKETVPIFVSCKVSTVTKEHLHEIKLMSIKFGGEYAKAAIITFSDFRQTAHTVYLKAKELDIAVIDCADIKNDLLGQKLAEIAQGKYCYKF